MKMRFVIVVIAGLWYSVFASSHTTIGAGGSFLIYNEGKAWYPGFNADFLMLGKPIPYLGIGGDIIYSRWSRRMAADSTEGYRGSYQNWRFCLLLRGLIPLEKTGEYFLFIDTGDGPSFGMIKLQIPTGQVFKDSHFNNSLFFGGGVLLKHFEIRSLFNLIFNDGVAVKWMNFNIGVNY